MLFSTNLALSSLTNILFSGTYPLGFSKISAQFSAEGKS